MRAIIGGLIIIALAGCASSPKLPEIDPDDGVLVDESAPKRLLACYVVLSFAEMVYTESFFFDRQRAIEDRGNLEIAADRVRDWPESQDWQETEARYATITIATALDESIKQKALEYLGGGISLGNFLRLAGRTATKAAVLEAIISDITRQRDSPDMTDDQRVDSCIARIGVVEERLKDLSGVG